MNWKLEGDWVVPQNSSDAEDRICVVSGDKAARAVTGPLIAAAPDLLAALEEAIKSNPYGVRVNGVWGDWRDAAAAAIAKATGDCNCRPCALAKAKGQA
mgnify:CR=1 FL=1